MKYLWAIIILVTSISCNDIIEEDLTGTTLVIMSPANNLQTNILSQTFWWEEVTGATSYNIQIVDSTFQNINSLLLDSNVTTNKFNYTLYPGKFQWRVKALNGNSETLYTTYSLTVDSTADLSNQQVIVISPNNNFATKQQRVMFKWYILYNANDYRIEIRTPDWAGPLVFNPEITAHDTISYVLDEGVYTFGIQANNGNSTSLYSTRSFIVDTTRPLTPSLVYPTNNLIVNDTVLTSSVLTFRWDRPSNNGSALFDTLFLSTDSTFSSSGLVFKLPVSDTTYSYTMENASFYYWKVKPYDAAGNIGTQCMWRKFRYEK
jgi:hypothetical protein